MQGLFVSGDVIIGNMERRQLHSKGCVAVRFSDPCECPLHQIFGKCGGAAVLEAQLTAGFLPIRVANAVEAAMIAGRGMPNAADLHRDPAQIEQIRTDFDIALGRMQERFAQGIATI